MLIHDVKQVDELTCSCDIFEDVDDNPQHVIAIHLCIGQITNQPKHLPCVKEIEHTAESVRKKYCESANLE